MEERKTKHRSSAFEVSSSSFFQAMRERGGLLKGGSRQAMLGKGGGGGTLFLKAKTLRQCHPALLPLRNLPHLLLSPSLKEGWEVQCGESS